MQGTWALGESHLPINILKLRDIWLFLKHWTPRLVGHPIRIQMDNTAAAVYLNIQKGKRIATMARGIGRKDSFLDLGQNVTLQLCPPFTFQVWTFGRQTFSACSGWIQRNRPYTRRCSRICVIGQFVFRYRDRLVEAIEALVAVWDH